MDYELCSGDDNHSTAEVISKSFLYVIIARSTLNIAQPSGVREHSDVMRFHC